MLKATFFKHSLLYFFAEAFNKGIVLITLPIFTYLLTPAEFGLISIYASITAVLIVLMGLSSHQAVIRNYHDNNVVFSNFMGALLPFIIIFTLLIVSVVILNRVSIATLINVDEMIIVLSVVVAFFGIYLQMELSYLQSSNSSLKYTKVLVIRNIFIIGLSVIFMTNLTSDIYYGRFYSELIVGIALFLFSMLNLFRLCTFSADFKAIKSSLSYSLPLVVSSLAGLILLSSDVLIINKFLGAEDAGIYSFGFSISMAVYILISAINNAWIPFYFKSSNDGLIPKVTVIASINYKVVLLFTLAVIMFSQYLVVILAPSSYYESQTLIPIITVGFVFLFLSNIFVSYLLYSKKTLILSVFLVIAAGINVVLNYFFIPIYGYAVAAWTTLFSYFVLFGLNFIYVYFYKGLALIKLTEIFYYFLLFVSFVMIDYMVVFDSVLPELLFKATLVFSSVLVYFYRAIYDLLLSRLKL